MKLNVLPYWKSLMLWLLIFLSTIIGYAFRYELDIVRKRLISVLIPSHSFLDDDSITLSRHDDGHFYLTALIDDKTQVKFLIDTGASDISISKRDAIRLGLDLKSLKYTSRYNTAAGITYAAPIRIKKLLIGHKVFYDVRAHVSSAETNVSLLGMSLLKDFSDFRFINDNLILKY